MQEKATLPMTRALLSIDSIGQYIYQATLTIYQKYPYWLQEKYRNYAWETSHFQDWFVANIAKSFKEINHRDELIQRFNTIFKKLFLPTFFLSIEYIKLITEFHNYIDIKLKFNPHQSSFSILLLDAENLSLNLKIEEFLSTICTYPLTVKLAFANWRNLGEKDLEFHNRNYELIHVPPGKNNADRKILSFGSSITLHYPAAKEVFVCSSDRDLNPLCQQLLSYDLLVYRVSQNAGKFAIANQKTGAIQIYSSVNQLVISAWEELLEQIKEVIKEEQSKNQTYWVKLSKVSSVFQNKYNLKISQAIAHHFPEKKTKDIFLELKQDFVTHQVSENSDLYIATFDVNIEAKKENNSVKQSELLIHSQEELEETIYQIVKKLKTNSKQEYISINEIATHFYAIYKTPITKVVKDLKIGKKLVNFLSSHQKLKVQKNNQIYQISLK
jgi:AraC-like DNA-binding protein